MAAEGKAGKGEKAAAKGTPTPEPARGRTGDEDKAAAKELALQSNAEDSEEEEAREPQGEAEEAPKPKSGKRPKSAAEAAKAEGGEVKRAKSKARPRPVIDAALKEALALRKAKNAKRPEFHRQEWFRYQRLGTKWRYPQGIQSKMRRHWRTHPDVVSIGHRGPKAARGLHPSGFREVIVHNPSGLEAVDPAREAVRIASSVGRRKREEIQKDARKLGIRVLNWRRYE